MQLPLFTLDLLQIGLHLYMYQYEYLLLLCLASRYSHQKVQRKKRNIFYEQLLTKNLRITAAAKALSQQSVLSRASPVHPDTKFSLTGIVVLGMRC